MCEIEFAFFVLCAVGSNIFPKFRHTYLPKYISKQHTIFCVAVKVFTLGDYNSIHPGNLENCCSDAPCTYYFAHYFVYTPCAVASRTYRNTTLTLAPRARRTWARNIRLAHETTWTRLLFSFLSKPPSRNIEQLLRKNSLNLTQKTSSFAALQMNDVMLFQSQIGNTFEAAQTAW